MKSELIGFNKALDLTLRNITPLSSETVPLADSVDRVVLTDLYSRVDSPSIDASLKDGYAVRSEEVVGASPDNPVQMKVLGTAAAGLPGAEAVTPGTSMRILTGAKIPNGARSVVAEEFTIRDGEYVTVLNHAEEGRNILPMGTDVSCDELVVTAGTKLSPGMLGLLAAAGYGEVPVFQTPKVAIVATGDEVVAPGQPLPKGKLYASNLTTLDAWCKRYGISASLDIVIDNPDIIRAKLGEAIESQDAVLTSGGAWTGDRDFVVSMLEDLGWRQFFHRVRLGPGKAVGFGLCKGKPVFVLPGGPPSNLMAFLQIALPGLLRLAGYAVPELPVAQAVVSETIVARHVDWKQSIYGRLSTSEEGLVFTPLRLRSRLQSMAKAEAILSIPEGVAQLTAGAIVPVQLIM